MFEGFKVARRRVGLPSARKVLAIAAVHAIVIGAAWVISVWNIERLDPPRTRVRIGSLTAPPAPPSPAPLGHKPAAARTDERRPAKRPVVVPVQPVALDAASDSLDEPASDEVEPLAVEERLVEEIGEIGRGVPCSLPGPCADADGLPTEVIVERTSLATAPTPLGRYDKLVIDGTDEDTRDLRGDIVLFLQIDDHGRVVSVQLHEGMSAELDHQAMQLALRFRFRPARDDAGVAIPSRVGWTFHVFPQPKQS